MISCIRRKRHSIFSRITSACIALSFALSLCVPPQVALAQSLPVNALQLPSPGTMVPLSTGFTPAMIKGVRIDPENPLQLNFIVNTGQSELKGESLRGEAGKLIKYFMAALTVPEDELWVNLSPYEQDRLIPDSFGLTDMGRDLLAQDYLLKQLTASLMHPEKDLGKKFWDRVYTKAQEKYGTTNIPVNTFNKVWIVPEKAVVYEHQGTAYVIERRLKVMLEQDYLALQENIGSERFGTDVLKRKEAEEVSDISSKVVREVLIPEIEREVNEGETFANLRQIYNSMILAVWFKQSLRQSLLGQVYADKNKVAGIDLEDPTVKEQIYQQYLEAFQTGVYDFIKEDYDPATQQVIPRKYFSGGFSLRSEDGAMLGEIVERSIMREGLSQEQRARIVRQIVEEGGGTDFDVTVLAQEIGEEADRSEVIKARRSSNIRLRRQRTPSWDRPGLGPDRLKRPRREVDQRQADRLTRMREEARERRRKRFLGNLADDAMVADISHPVGNIDYWLTTQVTQGDINVDMFRDYDYRNTGPVLDPAVVFRLALIWGQKALEAAQATNNPNRTVLIARDPRKIEPELIDAEVAAFKMMGLNVVYVATDSPNAVTSYSWAVQQFKPLLALFNTASHVSRPKEDIVRGFKVAIQRSPGEEIDSLTTSEIKRESLTQLRELVENPERITTFQADQEGSVRYVSVDENVIRFNSLIGKIAFANGSLADLGRALREAPDAIETINEFEERYRDVPSPLSGMKIVVDGSYTPSGQLTARTLESLGAEVFLIHGEIRVIEGEHKADPSIADNRRELEEKIKETGADMGLAFDLDGDRGAIIVPQRSQRGEYEKFPVLAPDNLIVSLATRLINNWGYKQTGKKLGFIRDVLGTYGVNERMEELGVDVFQTDAGYVFLKALRKKLMKEGYLFPAYGEKSGHMWLDVSGAIENPLAVAVLFAVQAKQMEGEVQGSLNPILDIYKRTSIEYSQSPRFQPPFHPDLLEELSVDPRNDTGWDYESSQTKPPSKIVALGKDAAVRMMKEEFEVGKEYSTSNGRLRVREMNTFQDSPQENGGLYRFADIVFEWEDGRFAGRFVFRASSNDPTFVATYEKKVYEGESVEQIAQHRSAVAGVVLEYLIDNDLALILRESMGAREYRKGNMQPIEADYRRYLEDTAMTADAAAGSDAAMLSDKVREQINNGELSKGQLEDVLDSLTRVSQQYRKDLAKAETDNEREMLVGLITNVTDDIEFIQTALARATQKEDAIMSDAKIEEIMNDFVLDEKVIRIYSEAGDKKNTRMLVAIILENHGIYNDDLVDAIAAVLIESFDLDRVEQELNQLLPAASTDRALLTRKVLFVDDQDRAIRANRIVLESKGYEVEELYNGSDAIELIRINPQRFSFVILDVDMPGFNGFETAKRISALTEDIKFIFFSGRADETEVAQAGADRLKGYAGFVRKGEGITKVIEKMEKLISAQESQGDSAQLAGKILLADDDPFLREIYEDIIGKLGFQVQTVADGKAALDIFREESDQIAVIITDLKMPRMSGAELAQAAQQINPSVPVILMTNIFRGSNSDEEKEKKKIYEESSPNIKRVLAKMAEFSAFDDINNILNEILGVSEEDQALTADKSPVGGIDLNPALLDMQIKRDANGVPLPVIDQPIHNMHIEGFIPIIINVTPIQNLPMLLGLTDTDDEMQFGYQKDLPAREPEQLSLLN